MNLRRYIQGKREGKEAHRIELEAMKDPFLSEALEGYDRIDADHIKSIDKLQQNLRRRFEISSRISLKKWSIAAVILLCVGWGGCWLMMCRSTELVPVPEEAVPLLLPATDTLILYQPNDKERIAAARLAERLRREEARRRAAEQSRTGMPLEFTPIRTPAPSIPMLQNVVTEPHYQRIKITTRPEVDNRESAR
jgi:hypothetical protein